MVPSPEESFRRLAIGDSALIGAIADPQHEVSPLRRLDDRTEALLRIGALVALDAPQSSYRTAVSAAERAGADHEDCLGVLVAIAGEVGSARVISAAPRIAQAAGYDIETALETIDPFDHLRGGDRSESTTVRPSDPDLLNRTALPRASNQR